MRVRTPKDTGLTIRDRRKALGLDQAALARRAGVSRQWIVGIEQGKGRADPSLVLRTLEVLGVVPHADDDRPADDASDRLPQSAVRVADVLAAHRGPGTGN